MNNLLYVSTLSSQNVLEYLFETGTKKPIVSAQKFHRLIAEGLASHKERVTVQTLSSPPVIHTSHKRRFWKLPTEVDQEVIYSYVPFINYPGLKTVSVFLGTFFKTFFWCIFKNKKKSAVLCDVLMVGISSAALLACKLTGTRVVGIVTDIPGMIFAKNKPSKGFNFFDLHRKINFATLTRFDAYILLTKPMTDIVNPKNQPFMVMEGLVDTQMANRENTLENKSPYWTIIYAGGLFEKYGIKDLIEAFMKLPDSDARLHLYGVGLMVEEITTFTHKDERIVYKGMMPNEIVVADQLKARLLVNPRPTHEAYTKYSFPSKNMEYMASGTPTLTTVLPGMPEEYKDYVFLIQQENTQGIYKVLSELLSRPPEDLHEFGKKAKEFVLKNKNKEVQSARILEFLGW